MSLIHSAAIQIVDKVAYIQIFLGQYLFMPLVFAIKLNPHFVVNIKYIRIVVKISTSISDKVEMAKSLLKIIKRVLHYY